ncbi:Hypp1681 [Branchiostoma lanceolatum]|uniref:Hypp1681 protein n=1 Tax=Branchiostoma lanceolatum TaxID=7740 RepID=A0A8K0EJQ7_BRALA|nr:Hypp1681 [Branchiostoma lanceolatum]
MDRKLSTVFRDDKSQRLAGRDPPNLCLESKEARQPLFPPVMAPPLSTSNGLSLTRQSPYPPVMVRPGSAAPLRPPPLSDPSRDPD